MFYCEQCRAGRCWPTSLLESLGACELCGTVGKCYDRPSSSLPSPDPVEEYELQATVRRRLRADAEEEWVLTLTGNMGDTYVISSHTAPIETKADDVPSLSHLYERLEEADRMERALRAIKDYRNVNHSSKWWLKLATDALKGIKLK